MPSILLIITGSIAAAKALDLAQILKQNNYMLDVILTSAAKEFVTEKQFKKIGIKNIFSNIFDAEMEDKIGHIELSRKNDLVLIYPATANFIAKAASGLAEDLATTAILASDKKVFMAPAMNVAMWHNNAVIENIKKLETRDIDIIYPEKGQLACGEIGEGRLKEPQDIYQIIIGYFAFRQKLAKMNIIVTAGGTREKIDPVRYIGNFSSGKQGVAIAKKFVEYGAKVTLIAAHVTCHIPANIRILRADSALQMQQLIQQELVKIKYDIGVFSAAIADFRVAEIANHKLKKNILNELNLKLVKNPDILSEISTKTYRPDILVGFAAESENLASNAKEKLKRKNCDYIVANNILANEVFASDKNDILLLSQKVTLTCKDSKEKIADFIIKNII